MKNNGRKACLCTGGGVNNCRGRGYKTVVFNLFCKIAPLKKVYLEIAPLPAIVVLSENIILFWK